MLCKDIILGSVMGHVIGDTLGLPVEFIPRIKLKKYPVSDMLEYGTHCKPKGTWSDDSSMMLCTLASIAETGEINYTDLMQRYSMWVKEGYMTTDGKPFGIGRTTLKALGNFWRGKDAKNCGCNSEQDNGNGSLMRVLPAILYLALNTAQNLTTDKKIECIHQISSLTHSHDRACIACGIYFFIVQEIIKDQSKDAIICGLKKAKNHYNRHPEFSKFSRLFSDIFVKSDSDSINSSGYVIDTLEASIWSLLTTNSYKECVLRAINLGGDTDTIAAVAGALAGILYGYKSIPQEWINSIIQNDMITEKCNQLYEIFCSHPGIN